MKIGFQISGSTKRKKIVDTGEGEAKKESVLSIEVGAGIVSDTKVKNEELIIPLPPPRNAVAPLPAGDIDQIAAQELLQDIDNTSGTSSERKLVIVTQKSQDSKAPLLMANVAPELLSCTNDDERFKVDISLRAENVDVSSESYHQVPIEQFGAAMLRGMGWTGPSEEEESDKKKYDIIPRENRLGLGATAKPPDEKDRRGSKEKKKKAKEEWKQKAEQQLEKQRLYVDDMVWIRTPAELAGSRAIVLQTAGVPGLNRVRLMLERNGATVDVDKKAAVLLSKSELDDKPFRFEEIERENRSRAEAEETAAARNRQLLAVGAKEQRGDRSDKESTSRSSRDKDRDRRKEGDDRYGKKRKESSGETGADMRDMKKSRQSARGDDAHSSALSWLRTGIRVRIVSSKAVANDKFYLEKAAVLDVYHGASSNSCKMATLRMESDGTIIENVKEKYLHTVLPAVGETCMILVGAEKGQLANLLEKRREKESAVVQLVEDMSEILTLPMDNIAALSRLQT